MIGKLERLFTILKLTKGLYMIKSVTQKHQMSSDAHKSLRTQNNSLTSKS